MGLGKSYTDEEEEEVEEGETEDEDEEDSYLLNRNILLRNYQERLFEVARGGNTIIYLPTGSGKTLIAIYVLCSRSSDIRRHFNEGGKRAFFACTTKVLVHQLGKVLRISTKFNVACFTGDMNVDTWNRETWLSAFEKNHVLVLTGEILKQLLELKIISPDRISLVVFDECHHAVADHPYRLALEILTAVDPPDAPLLIGLTSVLLNSNPKSDGVLPIIKSLECAFKGKVATEMELQDVLSFSANPTDKIIEYEENRRTSLTEKIIYFYEAIIKVFNDVVLYVDEGVSIPEGGFAFKERNRAKRIRKAFVQSKEHFEEYGVSCGLLSTLFYIIYFEKQRLLSKDKVEIQSLIYAKTELNKIRKATYKAIGEEETFDSLFRYSSPKVQKLIGLIRGNIDNSKGKLPSTIVFVRQRAEAVILAYLFKLLSAADKHFSSVKADFIVGSSTLNKETSLLLSKSETVLKQFASGTLNLLFSTNILEEGIDVSACNCVISFDFPVSYSSYFQARGRARDKRSAYYVFLKKSDASDKTTELNRYRNLEKVIHKTIFDGDDGTEQQEDEEKIGQKICISGKSGNIEINGIAAIKLVFRYCGSLPQDKHTFLSPSAWYENCCGMKKGFVRLPMNCPLREVVEGEPCASKKEAKRSVFLAVVKRLHEIGELDDELNVRSFAMREENFDDLFPHYRKENIAKNLAQPGTRKRKQIYKIKFGESLSGCLPVPGVKAYLHVIDLTVAFGKPELRRKEAIYDILRNPVTFALISKKKLFKIFQFPLFLDLGQIDCDLLVNYDEINLTESEFHDIKACHFALFKGVMRILKSCQVFDNESKEYSFFVAPVERNEEGRFVLNWDLIRCDFCKDSKSALVRYNPTKDRTLKRNWHCMSEMESDATPSTSLVPFDIERQFLWASDPEEHTREPQFAMTEADYKYFVIIPNYRKQDPPQCYIVNKFCHDLSPLSPFSAKYVDYVSYYKEKYEIDITNMKQPLLRVSALYNCCNFNRPRNKKARRSKEKYTEYEELLVPELCDVIRFDRRFWLKALLLPTILNRICHVYSAEEFRRRIVYETGLGKEIFPDWEPLRVDYTEANQEEEEEEDGISGFKNLEALKSSLPVSKLKDKIQANRKMIVDPLPERNLYGIGLCDLEFFVRSLEEYKPEETEPQRTEEHPNLNAPVPVLGLLSPGGDKSGPDLAQMVQACTSKSANDIVNYERLEVLGDSFLKFAVSLFLFRNYSVDEGILTSLKGKLVGNRNLLYCALAKNLPDVINVNDFAPLYDWNPPLLRVPERFVEAIVTKQVDPAVLRRLEISTEEQFSGILSEDTVRKNEEIIDNYEKYFEVPPSSLLPYKTIADKTVSDCLEALIGLYLLTLGLPGAFEFLSWVGVLPEGKGYHTELVEKPYQASVLVPDSDSLVMTLLDEIFYSALEDTLNYRFQNKALLLEALTHPSSFRNRVTDCYQRLEFLGDAVLDFLITLYVYEHLGDLTPGQITDIRSSLVNNVTFACLVVRYDIHKYMLSFSSTLERSVEEFVSFQINRNHAIDENIAILLEESDCLISESIQVPKALGDIFESLAGAIYLDSGNSLETVWTVYYRLMKREIDEFTKSIPKGSVRLLQEICGDKPYFESKVIGNKTKVTCSVYYENREIKAHGFGCNKQEGKKSACKLVLNKILELKK